MHLSVGQYNFHQVFEKPTEETFLPLIDSSQWKLTFLPSARVG
jgi:hypothetical protein